MKKLALFALLCLFLQAFTVSARKASRGNDVEFEVILEDNGAKTAKSKVAVPMTLSAEQTQILQSFNKNLDNLKQQIKKIKEDVKKAEAAPWFRLDIKMQIPPLHEKLAELKPLLKVAKEQLKIYTKSLKGNNSVKAKLDRKISTDLEAVKLEQDQVLNQFKAKLKSLKADIAKTTETLKSAESTPWFNIREKLRVAKLRSKIQKLNETYSVAHKEMSAFKKTMTPLYASKSSKAKSTPSVVKKVVDNRPLPTIPPLSLVDKPNWDTPDDDEFAFTERTKFNRELRDDNERGIWEGAADSDELDDERDEMIFDEQEADDEEAHIQKLFKQLDQSITKKEKEREKKVVAKNQLKNPQFSGTHDHIITLKHLDDVARETEDQLDEQGLADIPFEDKEEERQQVPKMDHITDKHVNDLNQELDRILGIPPSPKAQPALVAHHVVKQKDKNSGVKVKHRIVVKAVQPGKDTKAILKHFQDLRNKLAAHNKEHKGAVVLKLGDINHLNVHQAIPNIHKLHQAFIKHMQGHTHAKPHHERIVTAMKNILGSKAAVATAPKKTAATPKVTVVAPKVKTPATPATPKVKVAATPAIPVKVVAPATPAVKTPATTKPHTTKPQQVQVKIQTEVKTQPHHQQPQQPAVVLPQKVHNKK